MRAAWLILVGCSSPHHAGPDAAPDAYEYVPDAQCRADSISYAAYFSDGSTPLVGATLVVHGDPSRTATTDATGLFVLCAPQGVFTVDVDGSALDGTLVEASYGQNSGMHFPSFTPARITEVLAAAGQTYDPAKGLVVATQLGANAMALAAAHGTTLGAYTEPPWSATGESDVLLFPNVAPGMTTLSRLADGLSLEVAVAPAHVTWVDLPHIEL